MGILRSVLHHKGDVGRHVYLLLLVALRKSRLHLCLNDGLADRELGIHRRVATQHRQLGHGRHLVAAANGNATDDTRHGSGNGAEAEVHACTAHGSLGLAHRSLCLADSGLCLVITVSGVLEHVATHNLLFEQVLVAFEFQLGAVGLSKRSSKICIRCLQIGIRCLQLMLGIARVDDEEHLPFPHLLTFGHADFHELAAHLGHHELATHLRHDGNIRLTLQLCAELDGHRDILLLHRHGLVGRRHLFGHVQSARGQSASHDDGHHQESELRHAP